MTIIFKKPDAHVTDVHFAYGGDAVFSGLTATFPSGCITAVSGPNGSGKSTLLSLLAGVTRPHSGKVDLGGALDVAFAVQRSAVTDTFPISVADAVMMGRWRRLGLLRRPTDRDRSIVDELLGRFDLQTLRKRTLGELSGGQRQRVLLAQALAQQAAVVLLDEPTGGLDSATADIVNRQLRMVAAGGAVVVMATHDGDTIRAADHHVPLGR